MAAARERGVKLGRPASDLRAAERAAQLRDAGNSLARIATSLAAEQIPTPSGRGTWSKGSVQHVLARWDQEHASEATEEPQP